MCFLFFKQTLFTEALSVIHCMCHSLSYLEAEINNRFNCLSTFGISFFCCFFFMKRKINLNHLCEWFDLLEHCKYFAHKSPLCTVLLKFPILQGEPKWLSLLPLASFLFPPYLGIIFSSTDTHGWHPSRMTVQPLCPAPVPAAGSRTEQVMSIQQHTFTQHRWFIVELKS